MRRLRCQTLLRPALVPDERVDLVAIRSGRWQTLDPTIWAAIRGVGGACGWRLDRTRMWCAVDPAC